MHFCKSVLLGKNFYGPKCGKRARARTSESENAQRAQNERKDARHQKNNKKAQNDLLKIFEGVEYEHEYKP